MKKQYEQPIIEIIEIKVEDIITASGPRGFGFDPDKEESWDELFK